MATEIFTGRDTVQKLCAAWGLPFETVRRIVLDIGTDFAVTAYIEMFASRQKVDIDWDASRLVIKETHVIE